MRSGVVPRWNRLLGYQIKVNVEYVVMGACVQVLLMKQTLQNFNLSFDHIKIFGDNSSAIHMTKNASQHNRTKHIDNRYHFFLYHFEKGYIIIDCVSTNLQLSDIFTKPLDFNRFSFIRSELNLCIMNS